MRKSSSVHRLRQADGTIINPAREDGNLATIATNTGTTPVVATVMTIYTVSMAVADTQYEQALPANVKKFLIKTRDNTTFRLSNVTGKVAGATEPFLTVTTPYNEDGIKVAALTLYFACSVAGKVVEIVAWS